MSRNISKNLKITPLLDIHKELGAKLVPFAGWNMPVQFSGVVGEHICVRTKVGLFDVSHMGEIEIEGKQAQQLLKLMDLLEDQDDVQHVWSNFDIDIKEIEASLA